MPAHHTLQMDGGSDLDANVSGTNEVLGTGKRTLDKARGVYTIRYFRF